MMIGYVSVAAFWFWLIVKLYQNLPDPKLIATVYFFSAALAYSFDKMVHVIMGLYQYSLPGLSADWAAWVLDAILYPAVGCLFVVKLITSRVHWAIHVLGWTIGFSILEAAGVANQEIIYTGWQFEWSILVYLGCFATLALGLRLWEKE